jgi:hypothetical protein
LGGAYAKVVLQERVVPAEEDGQLDATFAVLESIALEKLVVRENLTTHQVGVLLQPLLEDLHRVLLPPLVQQSVPHDNSMPESPYRDNYLENSQTK